MGYHFVNKQSEGTKSTRSNSILVKMVWYGLSFGAFALVAAVLGSNRRMEYLKSSSLSSSSSSIGQEYRNRRIRRLESNGNSNQTPLELTNRGTFYEYLPGTYDFLLRFNEEHLEVWIKANRTDPDIYIVPCPDVTKTVAKCYDTDGIYNITLDIWREDDKLTEGIPKYLYTRTDGKVHIVDDPYDVFFDDEDQNLATDTVTPIEKINDSNDNGDKNNNNDQKNDGNDNSTEPLELTNRLKFYEYQPDTYDFLLRYDEGHLEMWIKTNRTDPHITIIPCPVVRQTIARCWDDNGIFNVTLDIWMEDKVDQYGVQKFLYTRTDKKVHIVDDPNDVFFDDNDQDLSTDTSLITNHSTENNNNNVNDNKEVESPSNGITVFGYHPPSNNQGLNVVSIVCIVAICSVTIILMIVSSYRILQRRSRYRRQLLQSNYDGVVKFDTHPKYTDRYYSDEEEDPDVDPKTLQDIEIK